MKTHLKCLAVVCCLFVAIFQLHSQGYIVPNGIIYVGSSFGGYQVAVLHNPDLPLDGSSYTGFILIPQNADSFQFSEIVDIGVRVFLVASNAPVSLQRILSQTYTELQSSPSLTYVFNNGVPFYVGL